MLKKYSSKVDAKTFFTFSQKAKLVSDEWNFCEIFARLTSKDVVHGGVCRVVCVGMGLG